MYNYPEGTLIKEIKEVGFDLEFNIKKTWNLYVKLNPYGKGYGFDAVGVTFGSCPSGEEAFEDNTEILDCISFSVAFDGVRHLEIKRENGDMAGYIYYPSHITDLFQKVNELMAEYCQEGAYDLL